MRYRSGAGRRNDELEAESLDNSSENSDGVESEGMSEGDGGADVDERGKLPVLVDRNSGGKGRMREANAKAPMLANRVRGSPISRRKRIGSRREGKEKETSDSEEELAFDGEEEKPSFNLLNSSLRATYNGRPSLVLESSNVAEKNGFVGSSSSLFKFSPLPKGAVEDKDKLHVGESSRAGAIVSSNVVIEEDTRPAFAHPSVVAEAARAAMSGKRSRKGPVIDQETREAYGKGSASVVARTDREIFIAHLRRPNPAVAPHKFRRPIGSSKPPRRTMPRKRSSASWRPT